MKVDRNEFFRQATIRICGSLNIKEAIKVFLDYIKDFIPVDRIDLNCFDSNLNVLKTVASAVKTFDEEIFEVIPMPDRDMKQRISTWEKIKPIEIINHPVSHPDLSVMLPRIGMDINCSIIIMCIDHDRQHVGNLSIKVKGNDRYTEEHASLLQMLREPFAIAMANALKHEEVIKLKDLLADDNRYLHRELREISGTEIVGSGFGLKDVIDMVRKVAPLNSPVLLLGETGVGKDVVAHAIHDASNRRGMPFIKVNCGAIPDNLIDSELFGHERGAFTGAISQKRGRFERANTGTIFLDEIGELPLMAQVRLLHVLQYHEFERIGGTNSVPVDIRIISATNRNLTALIESGLFREDLWFRLNVFPITIPPLRQRKADIPALMFHFIDRKCIEFKRKERPLLAPGAIDQLMSYDWPGNVRELENVIERSLILAKDGTLTFDNLLPSSPKKMIEGYFRDKEKRSLLPLNEINVQYIRHTLDLTQGKINGPDGAAELLKIHPNTLRKRMDRLGILYGRKKRADA